MKDYSEWLRGMKTCMRRQARRAAIVMLAMTPVVLNGETSENAVVTTASSEVQAVQQNYPLGVAYFRHEIVQQIIPAVGNGVKAHIVLSKRRSVGNANDVKEVYYIKESYQDNNPAHQPPLIEELIYHNIGGGKDYLGIKIFETLYKSSNDVHSNGCMEREVKLDDVSAQLLVDLMTGDTKWNNKTDIKYSETTNPKVMSPKTY